MRKTPKVVPISEAKRITRSSTPQGEEELPTLTCRRTLNQISFQLGWPLFVENTPNVKPSRGKLIDQRSVREPLSLDTRLDPLQQELLPLVVAPTDSGELSWS